VNAVVCASWVPAERRQVEKRMGEIEGFIGLFRNRLLAFAANLKNPENLDKTAGVRWRTRAATTSPRSWIRSITRATSSPGIP
jgi:hypothetical protein